MCDLFSCEFKGFLNGTDDAAPTRILSLLQRLTRWVNRGERSPQDAHNRRWYEEGSTNRFCGR